MSPADNLPNFDTMSPEEIMAWMESLAKRQGATEGFTTAADMQVAEIDPGTVVIDEPGYVPYGQDPAKWRAEQEAKKAAPPPKPVAPPAVPVSTPSPAQRPAASLTPPPQPVAPPPVQRSAPPVVEPVRPVEKPKPVEPEPASALSWLESLAADQSSGFPELDLSSLAADIVPAAAPSSEPEAAVNPMDWLESLSQSQGETASAAPPVKEPFAEGVNPVQWLESLAKRQGVRDEELVTEADLEVPLPETMAAEGPGYTEYSFETPGAVSKVTEETVPAETLFQPAAEVDPATLEDPAAWLDSLASSQGFSAETLRPAEPKAAARGPMTDDEISAALARGENIPQDQMQAWMSRQLEVGAQRPEPEPVYDPDAPAVPAELPDWLLDQVGKAPPPEEMPKVPASQPPALIDEIFVPPAVPGMPDWLKEEVQPQDDLDSIFAAAEPEAPPAPAPSTPVVEARSVAEPLLDATDTWGEALEYERAQDVDALPEWYVRNVNDPNRIATIERQARGEGAPELEETILEPEAELPPGQADAMPDWLSGVVSDEAPAVPAEDLPDWLSAPEEPVPSAPSVEPMPDWLQAEAEVEEPAAEPISVSDMPDWLKSVDVESADVPDWLKETLGTEEVSAPTPPLVVTPEPVAPPVQPAVTVAVIPPSAPVKASPAPVPMAAAQIDGAATLSEARAKAAANDLDESLRQYELLVRANIELEAVTGDLTKLTEKNKSHSTLFRVLGDSLMRQGKLQAALDIYRKALNQL